MCKLYGRFDLQQGDFNRPQLLLMDEPLAALDSYSKADILPYFDKLHKELSIPILYVSHAIEEVVGLADHLLLIENGQIIADTFKRDDKDGYSISSMLDTVVRLP